MVYKMMTNVPEDSKSISADEPISELELINLNKKVDNRKCFHHFGYLAELANHSLIPEDCLLCPKVIKCVLHSIKNSVASKDQ